MYLDSVTVSLCLCKDMICPSLCERCAGFLHTALISTPLNTLGINQERRLHPKPPHLTSMHDVSMVLTTFMAE